MKARWAISLCVAAAAAVIPVWALPPAAASNSVSDSHSQSPDTGPDTHHDVSRPLRDLAPARPVVRGSHADSPLPTPPASTVGDPALQTAPATASAPSATNNLLGVGNGFSGPQGTFTVNWAPPDTTGAVGPSDYVQVVNTGFAIFAKSTGAVIYGPAPTNTLWSGFGGYCQTTNDGDATVKYDGQADRWVITQFANVASNTGPYSQCVAVSKSGDPTGSYYRYSFQYASFPDYGKMGVWPDGYYMTFNMFSAGAGSFQGAQSCVYERAAMLAGAAARQLCHMTSTAYGGLLAADLDGPTPPPAGEANTQVTLGTTSTTLATWAFHVDWTSGTSTFTRNPDLTVAGYTQACNGGTCIPQPRTTNTLDSLADRIMYRLQYRNFVDHESLVVDDSVNVNSTQGVRWYELWLTGGVPTVHQQGTFSPDATSRWMGSAAMDASGDIAVGYSTSSSSLYPSVAYAGRLAGDPTGMLSQGETQLVGGSGSQTGTLTRWGDYSTMSVDPTDNCTFWFTSEYLPANGSFNWRTRIGSFKFPGCGAVAPGAPANLNATGGSGQVNLTWSVPTTGGAPTSYNVYRGTTPSGEGASPYASSVTTPYTDTAVTVGTTYYYTVTAVNSGGESGQSNEAFAAPTALTKPGAPTGLTATPGIGQVNLTWSAPTTGGAPTSDNVYRGTTPSGEGASPYASSVTTPYTDTAVTAGTTYYYKVTAVNSGGESGQSNEAFATPTDAAPTAVFGYTCSGANCSFNASASTDADSYNWTVGGTTFSSSAKPSHTFSSAGSYTVQLIVTDSDSSETGTSTTKTISCSGNKRRGLVCH